MVLSPPRRRKLRLRPHTQAIPSFEHPDRPQRRRDPSRPRCVRETSPRPSISKSADRGSRRQDVVMVFLRVCSQSTGRLAPSRFGSDGCSAGRRLRLLTEQRRDSRIEACDAGMLDAGSTMRRSAGDSGPRGYAACHDRPSRRRSADNPGQRIRAADSTCSGDRRGDALWAGLRGCRGAVASSRRLVSDGEKANPRAP